jgi:hypothetical protein
MFEKHLSGVQLNRTQGASRLALWNAPLPTIARQSASALGHGLTEGFLLAEQYAVKNRLIDGIMIPGQSEPAVNLDQIGGAASLLKDDRSEAARNYLALHQATRLVHANARVGDGGTEIVDPVGFIPVLIVVGVVGLAAFVAERYFASEEKKAQIMVDGELLKQQALVAAAMQADLAGIKPDSNTGKLLSKLADKELDDKSRLPWPLIIGGGVAVVGGGLAIKNRKAIKRWLRG